MQIDSCQFSDAYFPIMDGVGVVVHNYAYWLKAKYGKACIVAPLVKDYKEQVDYKLIRFKSVLLPGMKPYRLGLPQIDLKFKKTLAENKFNILHAHCPFVSGRLALNISRNSRIPLVATFHSKYRDDFKKVVGSGMVLKLMINNVIRFYNSADNVWVPNKSTGETLKEYGFKGNYEIMPNGTEFEIPVKSKYLELRKKGLDSIGAVENNFILLFVGQHRWEKNVRMIIEALRIIKSRGYSFKMVFVGEGYAAQDMKQLVIKYELTGDVLFTGVITDRIKLMNFYACSDLFVFPSIYDNAPLVVREAAAFNVPSIVVKNTSTAEGMCDNGNGFLIDNTQEALSEKIIELKQHPYAIMKAGEGARKSIYLHWGAIVDRAYNRYAEIISEYDKKQKKIILT